MVTDLCQSLKREGKRKAVRKRPPRRGGRRKEEEREKLLRRRGGIALTAAVHRKRRETFLDGTSAAALKGELLDSRGGKKRGKREPRGIPPIFLGPEGSYQSPVCKENKAEWGVAHPSPGQKVDREEGERGVVEKDGATRAKKKKRMPARPMKGDSRSRELRTAISSLRNGITSLCCAKRERWRGGEKRRWFLVGREGGGGKKGLGTIEQGNLQIQIPLQKVGSNKKER